jgi:hypothetical protein
LTGGLLTAFTTGVGSDVPVIPQPGCTYDSTKINNGKQGLKNCRVIATAGGMAVFNAIKGQSDNPQFVSLVTYAANNAQPNTSGTNCRGGVIIHSWDSNGARIKYLTTVKSFQLQNIYLYYNPDPNVGINTPQLADWATNTGSPTTPQVIQYSGNFARDFGSSGGIIPSAATAIVISADPSFGGNMNPLMAAVNGWLNRTSASNTFVVYPLQEYKTAPSALSTPTGRGAFIGPSLTQAYQDLGAQARTIFDAIQDVGFQPEYDQQSFS